MSPGDGLSRLQMGKSRHHPIGACFGLIDKGCDEGKQSLFKGVELIAHPEFEISGHLIIPRPCSMQTSSRFANYFLETRFDIHVNILKRR